MDLSVDLGSATPIVRISGDMRLWGKQDISEQIRESLHGLMIKGHRRIILNIAGVLRIDSRGIGCLARCHATAITNNTEIVLVVQPGHVLETLRQVNFVRLYPVYNDEASALIATVATSAAPPPRQ